MRVQLVKYILHLLAGTGCVARDGRRPAYAMSGDVRPVGSHSGRLASARSATAVTAAKMMMASGMFSGIRCGVMHASFGYGLVLLGHGGLRPRVRVLGMSTCG